MENREYGLMYTVEDDHWWYVGLRKLALAFIERSSGSGDDQTILDAGCGTGGMLAECSDYNAFGLDISDEAIKFCKVRKLKNVSRGSICDMPFEENSFDVVISLDVLYHLDVSDDSEALKEFHRVLSDGGTLLLNLPAYDFLKGAHDKAVHTRHRYTLREVKDKVERAGFAVERITYRNTFLFPLIASARIMKKLIFRESGTESDVKPLPGLLNRFLRDVLILENRLILRGMDFPFGLSVFCAARKMSGSSSSLVCPHKSLNKRNEMSALVR